MCFEEILQYKFLYLILSPLHSLVVPEGEDTELRENFGAIKVLLESVEKYQMFPSCIF